MDTSYFYYNNSISVVKAQEMKEIALSAKMHRTPGLPDGIFSKQKSPQKFG
jgi:hypothetical protein